MDSSDLPTDLIRFLESGRSLEYDSTGLELGDVTIHCASDIELKEFAINSEHNAKWAVEDPHHDDSGCYCVPAFDLLKSCSNYSPVGQLIYIPKLSVYGQFDSDHRAITYFPRITWWNIVGDPRRYLNAQWQPQQFSFNPILNPVGQFEFRHDWG